MMPTWVFLLFHIDLTVKSELLFSIRDGYMKTAVDVLNEAAELKARKSKDYQGSKWEESDYFPYGKLSFNHMLWTKMLRIMSVSEQSDTNFESLKDSLIDMAVYSAMYAAWLDNNEDN